MNRGVLYRGKRIDNGEWAYGSLIKLVQGDFIVTTDHYNTVNIELHEKLLCNALWEYNDFDKVLSQTICEFIGLTDKNGTKIFEGDIVISRMSSSKYQVIWEDCQFKIKDNYGNIYSPKQEFLTHIEVEVIGNIFDNPELIKETNL